jgi:hypothetical protein
MHLMKSNSESINGVLPPSVLGAGITMIKKLLEAKFTQDLGGGGLFGGGVDTKIFTGECGRKDVWNGVSQKYTTLPKIYEPFTQHALYYSSKTHPVHLVR